MPYTEFEGDNGMFGVCNDGAVLYEAEFSQLVAAAIAEMNNSPFPPVDWLETSDRLRAMGLPF